MSEETCPRCGSDRVIPQARFVGAQPTTRLMVSEIPESPPWGGKYKTSDVCARVCGSCGFVETFATDAEGLWRAFETYRGKA